MRRVFFALLLTAVPRVALACPICFGENDSPMTAGISYGIYLMLGIIAVLWVAFGSFFIYLWRRSHLAAAEGPANRLRQGSGGQEPGHHVHQEGTL
jgi:hypothetical protein